MTEVRCDVISVIAEAPNSFMQYRSLQHVCLAEIQSTLHKLTTTKLAIENVLKLSECRQQ